MYYTYVMYTYTHIYMYNMTHDLKMAVFSSKEMSRARAKDMSPIWNLPPIFRNLKALECDKHVFMFMYNTYNRTTELISIPSAFENMMLIL